MCTALNHLFFGVMMINLDELFNDSEPKIGTCPANSEVNSGEVGQTKPNTDNVLSEIVSLSRLSRQIKWGIGTEQDKFSPCEDVATDNLCDGKIYNPNPIAVCLLLACCHKIEAKMSEAFKSFLALRTMSPADQVKSWAMLCAENNVEVVSVIYPYIESKNEGNDCMRCQHLNMTEQSRPGTRRRFYWTCKQHHQVLEAYLAGERVLIAPEECKDFTPPS